MMGGYLSHPDNESSEKTLENTNGMVLFGKLASNQPNSLMKWRYYAIFPDIGSKNTGYHEVGPLKSMVKSVKQQGYTPEFPQEAFYRHIRINGVHRNWLEYHQFLPLNQKEIDYCFQ